MRIHFENSDILEYAGLSKYNNNEEVLKGELFDSDLNLIDQSQMSLDIGDDGNNCSVS